MCRDTSRFRKKPKAAFSTRKGTHFLIVPFLPFKETTVIIEGGYQPVTPIFLGNLLTNYFSRAISWPSVQIAFACLEMTARREAAAKSRPKWKKSKERFCKFTSQEISHLTGLNLRAVGKGLSKLRKAGILRCEKTVIQFEDSPQGGAVELIEELACKRSTRRMIPVPRRAIRFIAGHSTSTLSRVMIGYWVRGLSMKRKTYEVCGKGTVKASWLADTFQLSLRSVRYAQAKLKSLGWIGKDIGSKQWKLNIDGAYFQIDLKWSPSLAVPNSRIAPPPGNKCTSVAPPIENKFTPSDHKNQSTVPKTGVLKTKKEMRATKPSVHRIFKTDLFDKGRLEMLFLQAVKLGWARQCEADRLKFFGAAIRARQAEGDSERIFAGILRKRLWKHVTARQEDEARLWLRKEREVAHGPNPQLAQTLSTLFQKTAFRSQSLTMC